jgi:hypothetical protein
VVRVRYRGVPYPVSPFFSDVRRWRAEPQVHRVRRCDQASGGRCIPRDSRRRERVRWALVRRFHRREQHGREVVRVDRRDGLGSAMFLAA